MSNIVGNFFTKETNSSADETMVINSLGALSAAAIAYLSATLEATTPEVRRIFGEYSTQCTMAQEALSVLALKKGWITPYDTIQSQLQSSISDAASVLSAH